MPAPSIPEAATQIEQAQAALLRGEIDAGAFRATMRHLRAALGEGDYMRAKVAFASATSRERG